MRKPRMPQSCQLLGIAWARQVACVLGALGLACSDESPRHADAGAARADGPATPSDRPQGGAEDLRTASATDTPSNRTDVASIGSDGRPAREAGSASWAWGNDAGDALEMCYGPENTGPIHVMEVIGGIPPRGQGGKIEPGLYHETARLQYDCYDGTKATYEYDKSILYQRVMKIEPAAPVIQPNEAVRDLMRTTITTLDPKTGGQATYWGYFRQNQATLYFSYVCPSFSSVYVIYSFDATPTELRLYQYHTNVSFAYVFTKQ